MFMLVWILAVRGEGGGGGGGGEEEEKVVEKGIEEAVLQKT